MMKFKIFIVVAILNTFAMQANAQEPSTPGPCVDSGGLRLICDFNGIPEDLVIVPDTGWVLASVFSREDTTALYLVDSQSKTTYSLYSPEIGDNRFDRQAYPNCPGAPDLSNIDTHGLSIRPQVGNPGIHTLYAVSHGAREAVEVFELDATADMPQISWIGCVLMPDGLDANDVSSMQDGSILVTVLMHPGDSFEDLLAGRPTGGVYRWTPGMETFTMLEGSELPGNNGIQVSADESEIFVAASGLSAVITLANTNPTRIIRRTRTLEFVPDNVVYDERGYLLTAGMRNDEPTCSIPAPISNCPRGTIAVSIHPDTMKDTIILQTPPNPNFSGATMAITPGGNEVWVGSFLHPRIAYRLLE